jgi:hypothetical protein
MSQITIRDLPESVENELRKRAAERRVSLSKMVSMLVLKALGFEPQGDKKRDVSCVFGRWDPTEAAEFENNTAIFRKIDDEIWK